MNNYILAFDYSMSSPSLAIKQKNDYEIHYLTNVKKYSELDITKSGAKSNFRIKSSMNIKDWNSDQERYDFISEYFMNVIRNKNIPLDSKVLIEGYSMGSKGKVFHIAENTQSVKNKLWKYFDNEISIIAPTSLKKHATGNGNASKLIMEDKFFDREKFYMYNLIGCNKGNNPSQDIVDSYFLSNF